MESGFKGSDLTSQPAAGFEPTSSRTCFHNSRTRCHTDLVVLSCQSFLPRLTTGTTLASRHLYEISSCPSAASRSNGRGMSSNWATTTLCQCVSMMQKQMPLSDPNIVSKPLQCMSFFSHRLRIFLGHARSAPQRLRVGENAGLHDPIGHKQPEAPHGHCNRSGSLKLA